ncbi:hypothetical protein H8S95_08695 [Pontibacter sp. KCTC 32443]|uniref:hypothetical protein n=1 Tax=Pontibacter TaxID=323449 RepID=UPI00164EA31E|nr:MULTISPECIES: hypothetical protein [Pontibacter]MBC5774137.1 hypothetical protein [Pontibacter sp. KCTC 32443]
MKNTLQILMLYVGLALFTISCEQDSPEPVCIEAEVVGPDDCSGGWYVLRVPDTEEDANSILPGGCYVNEKYVKVNNLPEDYKQAGLKINVALEERDDNSQVCLAIYMMYPEATITRICNAEPDAN